ncbi:aldose 1-epimerase [Hoeflea prorocentri]|uniref:Aldose 1-epimerase n=1 Tax=Hoeflea prorocentri TaxID=1922333 RepID=A0A9X3UJK0_9HYPH|nr:aldose 1-epimerase [Hoeflea prorocentri]MCY6381761.1 aldose 1-epimerase [Hoeflea prorocentri]MDA5399561.1 aldose 1-epimerase [Hoeflea prorocentri]
MQDTIEIVAGAARLVVSPDMGGGIARLDYRERPVLRSWASDETNPFSLASNILVPFSNRISGGGFNWNGNFHVVEPNLTGEAFPIHGDGFQKPWTVRSTGADALKMELSNGNIGPYRYAAAQTFRLSPSGLAVDLEVTNKADETLPFGCGFHPWFPRSDATRLSFAAAGVWLEDARYLPDRHLDIDDNPDWDFSQPRLLPASWINNGFTGWDGKARIDQGQDAVSLTIRASQNLGTAIVFSPDGQSGFFCFEPVSHPVDAFNLPGNPGLKSLTPGESLRASMELSWS